jgi:hypothetical protein
MAGLPGKKCCTVYCVRGTLAQLRHPLADLPTFYVL